jgi:hypothetical protein
VPPNSPPRKYPFARLHYKQSANISPVACGRRTQVRTGPTSASVGHLRRDRFAARLWLAGAERKPHGTPVRRPWATCVATVLLPECGLRAPNASPPRPTSSARGLPCALAGFPPECGLRAPNASPPRPTSSARGPPCALAGDTLDQTARGGYHYRGWRVGSVGGESLRIDEHAMGGPSTPRAGAARIAWEVIHGHYD